MAMNPENPAALGQWFSPFITSAEARGWEVFQDTTIDPLRPATLFAAGGLRSLPYFIQFDAAVTSIRYASYLTMPVPTVAVSDPSGSMYLLLSASPFGSLAITKLQPPQILNPSRSGSR